MKSRHIMLLVAAVTISGFLGGSVTAFLLTPHTALAAQGSDIADTIQARSIVIVDDEGRPMIELGVKDGGPFIGLKRKNGDYCAITREIGNGGAASVIFGSGPNEQVSLMVDSGMPRVDLFRGLDVPLAKLQVVPQGAGLAFRDNAGTARVYLGQLLPAEPNQESKPALVFLDSEGKSLWEAP